jgi:hypothetical protein
MLKRVLNTPQQKKSPDEAVAPEFTTNKKLVSHQKPRTPPDEDEP